MLCHWRLYTVCRRRCVKRIVIPFGKIVNRIADKMMDRAILWLKNAMSHCILCLSCKIFIRKFEQLPLMRMTIINIKKTKE